MTNILSAIRPKGFTATLGDSLVAQIYNTQTIPSGALVPPSFGGYNHFSWGNARAGHPLTPIYNGGVSGERTDQIIARTAAAIASGAGHLYYLSSTNDVSQAQAGYTTVNTVGPNQNTVVTTANVAAVCWANIKYSAQEFLKAGGQWVTLVLPPGAENMNTAQIAAMHDIRQQIMEFAETTRGVGLFDMWKEIHDPALSSTTTIRFKAGYAQEASGSGVHENNLGGYMVGKAFATYLNQNFPPVPYLCSDVNEIPSISTRNLLANPLFVTASGGTNGAGSSGTVPGSWSTLRSGGSGTQTVVTSTGTPADGSPGLECIMACTFSAAGDIIRLQQDATIGNVNIGDILMGSANISVDAGGALAGVYMDLQYNDGTTTWSLRDLLPLNNVAIGTDGYTVGLKTPSYPVTVKAGSPFCSMRIQAQASAAGTATIRVRQVQARKRFAL